MTKNKIWDLVIIVALITITILLLSFSNKKFRSTEIGEVKINIEYPGTDNILINVKDINKILYNEFDSLSGKIIDSVNVEEILNKLKDQEYIKNAEVFLSVNSNLLIDLEQREPIMRVIEESSESYLIDKDGKIIPVRNEYPCKVIICNGFIRTLGNARNLESKYILQDSTLQNSILNDAFVLAKNIYDDEFLKSQIAQIYITEKQEFELIPLVGNHIIEFGSLDNIDNKLIKLKKFYIKLAKKGGWAKYKSINLKYKDQVVCTKR